MYNKTHEVMLEGEIKKLRDKIKQLEVTINPDAIHRIFKILDEVFDKFEVYEDRFKKIEKILKMV